MPDQGSSTGSSTGSSAGSSASSWKWARTLWRQLDNLTRLIAVVVVAVPLLNPVLPLLDHLVAGYVERVFAGFEPEDVLSYYWWPPPGKAQRMIRVTDGLCYLVHLEGDNAGKITIVEDEGWWVLPGPTNDAQVKARAVCWRFPWMVD